MVVRRLPQSNASPFASAAATRQASCQVSSMFLDQPYRDVVLALCAARAVIRRHDALSTPILLDGRVDPALLLRETRYLI